MTKKTFNIGEYAKGGVITVEITGKTIAVIAKDWDFSAGSLKSSDQSNAKEFDRVEVQADDYQAYRKMDNFLNEITSAYHSNLVLNFVKENVNLIMA